MTPLTAALIPATIPAHLWIDIVCLAIVAACAIWDAVRGLSATIAQIAALVIAFKLSFLIYPRIASALPQDTAPMLAASFALTLAAAVAIFLITRFAIARIAHLVLMPPIDNILGAVTGTVKAMILLFAVFSTVSLIAGKSYPSTAFAKSVTGARAMPALERLLAPEHGRLPYSQSRR